MKFKFFKVGCAVAASLLTLAGCSSGTAAPNSSSAGGVDKQAPLYSELPANIKEAGRLRMGSQLSSPPVIYLDSDAKTVKGLNKDLAEALSKELGVPIEFQQISFASLTPSLQTKKIDAIFDTFSDTAERQKTFDFIDYVNNGLTYLVPEGNPENISTATGLCGKSLSGVRGTSLVAFLEAQAAKCAAEGKPELTVQQFASASDARLQVQNGKSAAFLGQSLNMAYLASTAGNGKIFDAVTDDSYPLELIGMAVNKSDAELRTVMQKAFRNIMDNGSYASALKTYKQSELAIAEPTINGGK